VVSSTIRTTTTTRRADIQFLRALAVGLVVLYHLWPGRLSGGFIGVDVFFVISGFLIVTHIARDIERGTFRLRAFWARRMRRLLPASLTVIATVVVATLLLLPRSVWEQFLREARASSLYFENWALASASTDYLRQDEASSPLQHFWSLSVEEQFYVAIPLLLVAGVSLAAFASLRARTAMVLILATIAVGSLAYSSWFSSQDPQVAYFST
jgi:peptidoglycan/LPS O-acetylase OafA/YrhL